LKLDDYFKKESGSKIREAVFKISQIGLLENAINHMDNKIKDYVKKENKLSSKAEEIREELNENYKLLREYKDALNNFKEQKDKAQIKEDLKKKD